MKLGFLGCLGYPLAASMQVLVSGIHFPLFLLEPFQEGQGGQVAVVV